MNNLWNTNEETSALTPSRRRFFQLAGASTLAVTATAACTSTSQAPAGAAPSLFHTVSGQGRNVLFLHGWACDSHDWSWQLAAMENQFRCFAVDLRGHGRSEVTPSGTYKPDDFVTDIENFMLKHGSGQKFILVGHSMGGQIAARVASKRPDLVEGVVSVDGALGWEGDSVELFRKTSETMQKEDPASTANAMFKLVYAPTTLPSLKVWHARRCIGTPAHVVRESFPPLFFGSGQVGAGEASEKFCKSLTVPIYHLATDPQQARRMRPWFTPPKSKIEAWDKAGHWIMQDRPDDVNKAIAAWISKL